MRLREAAKSGALRRNRDVIRLCGGRRRGDSVLLESFKMERDALANQTLHCGLCRCDDAESRQIGYVSAPSGCGFFVDDEIGCCHWRAVRTGFLK